MDFENMAASKGSHPPSPLLGEVSVGRSRGWGGDGLRTVTRPTTKKFQNSKILF